MAMGSDSERKAALAIHYELYSTESAAQAKAAGKAAEEIDAAITEAMDTAIAFWAERSDCNTFLAALQKAVKTVVGPVFTKWEHLGAHDTEPEWHAVDVIKEHLRNRLGFDVNIDGWEMRGWL